jgi:CDI immunity proteins
MQKYLLSKTLEEIENDYWQKNNFPTGLIEKCYYARKKKLQDLEPVDARLLISQNIGLAYIVPLAMKWLEKDILTEAIYYPGDLLESILRAPADFWKSNQDLWKKYDALLKKVGDYIIRKADLSDEIKASIQKNYEAFSQNGY